MTIGFSDVTLLVSVADRASMDDQLETAVTLAQKISMYEGRRGILVTRQGPDKFTVALSDTVPFGLTREAQTWR
jgi:hypothetical protein